MKFSGLNIDRRINSLLKMVAGIIHNAILTKQTTNLTILYIILLHHGEGGRYEDVSPPRKNHILIRHRYCRSYFFACLQLLVCLYARKKIILLFHWLKKKAFGTVERFKLCQKLGMYGIRGKLFFFKCYTFYVY